MALSLSTEGRLTSVTVHSPNGSYSITLWGSNVNHCDAQYKELLF